LLSTLQLSLLMMQPLAFNARTFLCIGWLALELLTPFLDIIFLQPIGAS
jgi:hypothetical protein